MRTFISINPDETTKNQILDIQNDLKTMISSTDRSLYDQIKWESKDKFHVTLFFIGETDKILLEKIDRKLSVTVSDLNIGRVSFEARGINAFPKLRYPRVIILDLINDNKKVNDLHSNIRQILESEGLHNHSKFHPHITLGRVKRDRKINLSNFELRIELDIKFTVNEFCLMESKLKSTGSEYSLIKKYNL